MKPRWKSIAPPAVAIVIALLPAPAGLPPHAWYFFAIFAGVVTGVVLEPLPGGAVALIGVSLVTVLARWVLFSPEQLAEAGFNPVTAPLTWALSGFSNGTVWLIFGAFVFALGYEKTGLGRRLALLLVGRMGRKTLTLGYAVAVADAVLAPFTPSNTARSGGTIYPVIRQLPALYDSKPNDPSARRIGSYLMWVAIAATSVTSSLFLTGLAPNLLAAELVEQAMGIHLTWTQWFIAFAPSGVLLLALVPLLTFLLYPPEVRDSTRVPEWAAQELGKMGDLTAGEVKLAVLVVLALVLWIVGGDYVNATTVALGVISLMLVTRVITWDDILANKAAWNTLAWFAGLVALSDGLSKTGFARWFADAVASRMASFSSIAAAMVLVLIFFVGHYLFASITAHVTALLPVMLAAGSRIPGINTTECSLLLCLTLGIMGILTPYASGPAPVYYGSGYIPPGDYWRLGATFGAIFIAVFLLIGVPWILALN